MLPDAVSMVSAANYLVSNVTVDGADGVGIYAEQSGPGRTTNNRVSNTLADAIHHTNSSHDIYVAGNTVRNAGDDMIAGVGYVKNGYVAETNLLIELNDLSQGIARGITVVGGNQVTIRNNKISQTTMAGIYIASETAYTTYGDDDIVVMNNTIDHPAQKANTGHAGLFSYSDTTYLVQNVLFRNNVVTNDGNGQGLNVFGNIANVYASGNTLDGSPLSGHGTTTGAPTSITGATVKP
jgi:parallel beta-helix repeat protein